MNSLFDCKFWLQITWVNSPESSVDGPDFPRAEVQRSHEYFVRLEVEPAHARDVPVEVGVNLRHVVCQGDRVSQGDVHQVFASVPDKRLSNFNA